MNNLPIEIIRHILLSLDSRSTITCLRVCKLWRAILISSTRRYQLFSDIEDCIRRDDILSYMKSFSYINAKHCCKLAYVYNRFLILRYIAYMGDEFILYIQRMGFYRRPLTSDDMEWIWRNVDYYTYADTFSMLCYNELTDLIVQAIEEGDSISREAIVVAFERCSIPTIELLLSNVKQYDLKAALVGSIMGNRFEIFCNFYPSSYALDIIIRDSKFYSNQSRSNSSMEESAVSYAHLTLPTN